MVFRSFLKIDEDRWDKEKTATGRKMSPGLPFWLSGGDLGLEVEGRSRMPGEGRIPGFLVHSLLLLIDTKTKFEFWPLTERSPIS